MANVTGTILNLFNGVSQQTSSLRLPTQGEEQVNMYPSLVQGLVKRPPLEVISAIEKAVPLGRNGTFHVVDRGGDNVGRERTLIHISPDGITAFHLEPLRGHTGLGRQDALQGATGDGQGQAGSL